MKQLVRVRVSSPGWVKPTVLPALARWASAVLVPACLSWCGAAGFAQGATTSQPAPATQQPEAGAAPAPRLEISSSEWNFGEVWQGEALRFETTLKNVGHAPLEIIDVKSSCGCTVPTRPKSPLAPGESDKLVVSYDGQKRVGQTHQTVTLTTNDPTQPSVQIKVIGNVKPLYEVEPKEGLVFGQLFRTSEQSRTIKIINKYTEPMRLELKAQQESGPFELKLTETEPGRQYTLSASTRPPLPVGRFNATVVLRTGIERLPEITTLVYGFVQPPVAVRPPKIYLPKNSVAEIKRSLFVSHAPDYAAQVTAVSSTHDAIKVELGPATRPAGDASKPEEFQIIVTLPPGDRIPEGEEPKVEITTTARDPEYQKLVVPIQIIPAPRAPASPAPATQPTGREGQNEAREHAPTAERTP